MPSPLCSCVLSTRSFLSRLLFATPSLSCAASDTLPRCLNHDYENNPNLPLLGPSFFRRILVSHSLPRSCTQCYHARNAIMQTHTFASCEFRPVCLLFVLWYLHANCAPTFLKMCGPYWSGTFEAVNCLQDPCRKCFQDDHYVRSENDVAGNVDGFVMICTCP